MKRLLTLCAVLILAASCRKDGIREDAFSLFNDQNLPTLTLSFSQEEWNRLLGLYDADSRTKEYVRCDVALEGGQRSFRIKDAGLRLRGQTSRRRPQSNSGRMQHFHAGLHLRKFSDSNPDIDGFRRINLKYPKEDPSHIREHYCYDLLRRYGVWTAPESSWCKLNLDVGGKNSYYGAYLMTESIDRQYLKKRPGFGSADGFLWKCAWGANLRDANERLFHIDENKPDTYPYELKDDNPALFETAKAQLKDFITNFNSLQGDIFRNWVNQALDVELLLRTYAVNVAVGHWDDYWNDMNNFYIYFNSRDEHKYRMYMIGYDYDNTLGTSHNCGVQHDSGRQDPYKWGLDECPLISKLLTFSEYRDMYTRFLRELGAEGNQWFGYDASVSRIRAWQKLIEPHLPNDTGEDGTLADRPASWGNHHEYRILEDGPDNWFRVKSSVLQGL